MTGDVVIDTNVFIVSLLNEEDLNENERNQRPMAVKYINYLERGDYTAHLPTIGVVEICGVSRWEVGLAAASAVRARLADWVSQRIMKLYDINEDRMGSASTLVMKHNVSHRKSLSAPDASFIALSEELGFEVITLEKKFENVTDRATVLDPS